MKIGLFIALMLSTFVSNAQVLTYRNGDPFLFCTHGRDDPSRCWWPLPPFLGTTYMTNPACEPNPYGKPWSADDFASLEQYMTVCPAGIQPGGWDSAGGQPELVPTYH
jgi:hypothetical protein